MFVDQNNAHIVEFRDHCICTLPHRLLEYQILFSLQILVLLPRHLELLHPLQFNIQLEITLVRELQSSVLPLRRDQEHHLIQVEILVPHVHNRVDFLLLKNL